MIEMTAAEAADWLSLEGEEFVRQAYQRLLERPADLSSLHNYTAQLMAGMPKAQLVTELQNSPEGRLVARRRGRVTPAAGSAASAPAAVPVTVQDLLVFNGEEFVLRAYRALLGREADPSGLQHYTQRLAQGDSREQIIADLHSDAEGRAYDAHIAGLEQLHVQFEHIQAEQVQPVGAIKRATDLLALHGADFVKSAFIAILGRDADPEGLANYLRILGNGYSRSHVVAALATSPEARQHGSSLPGLRKLVNAYRRGQATSWAGWYWRNVKGAESDLPPAREARLLNMPARNR